MPDGFRAFGGVDFSGAREPLSNLWSAVGEVHGDRLRIVDVRPHAFRADLAAFVASGWRAAVSAGSPSILWGADFPFGLPIDVCDALGAGADWRSAVGWVADRPADEVRAAAGENARALRRADTGGALAPLDLRLYKQTVEGLRWLHALLEAGEVSILPHDPREAAVHLIEVYPSATVKELGLPRRRAPSRPGECRARAAALRTYLDFADARCEASAVTLEDAWDATIACLTAFLCRDDLDQPHRLAAAPPSVIAREGWIYRPPATLS